MYLGQVRETLSPEESQKLVQELLYIPGKLESILDHDSVYDDIAKACSAPPIFFSSGAAFISPSR